MKMNVMLFLPFSISLPDSTLAVGASVFIQLVPHQSMTGECAAELQLLLAKYPPQVTCLGFWPQLVK